MRFSEIPYPRVLRVLVAPLCRVFQGLSNGIEFRVDRYLFITPIGDLRHGSLVIRTSTNSIVKRKNRKQNILPYCFTPFDREKELSFDV